MAEKNYFFPKAMKSIIPGKDFTAKWPIQDTRGRGFYYEALPKFILAKQACADVTKGLTSHSFVCITTSSA